MTIKPPDVKLKNCQCGEVPRLCYTGIVWKITCDNDDCPQRDVYGKTKEDTIDKYNYGRIRAKENL